MPRTIQKIKGAKVAKKSELVRFLQDLQVKVYRRPDSDGQEYCRSCGRSPYNDPPHTTDCKVIELEQLLGRIVW